MKVDLADLTVEPGPMGFSDWNAEGVVAWPGLFDRDDPLLDAYATEWATQAPSGLGWPDCTPYARYPALRRLCCDPRIALQLAVTLGGPAGVHLNLTGWISTERNWHADTYLNPAFVGDNYAAMWLALGDIHPDSGPFEYVPGSHRWPYVTREKIGQHVDLDDPMWPKWSEEILTPLFTDEINRRRAKVVEYLPQRGDVLFWHPRLLHRGSPPRVPGRQRPALIAHYSRTDSRPDMPPAVQHEAGGWWYPL